MTSSPTERTLTTIPSECLTAAELETVHLAMRVLVDQYRVQMGAIRSAGLTDLAADADRRHDAAIKLAEHIGKATKVILVGTPANGGAQ